MYFWSSFSLQLGDFECVFKILSWSGHIHGFVVVVFFVHVVESSYWNFKMLHCFRFQCVFLIYLWFPCFVFCSKMFIWEPSCVEDLMLNKPMFSCIMMKCFFLILFLYLNVFRIFKSTFSPNTEIVTFWKRRSGNFLKSQLSCQYDNATYHVKLV